MARLEISSKDAERVARRFDDLIKPKGLNAIRRRAVTDIGSGLRKDLRSHRAGAVRHLCRRALDTGPGAGTGRRQPGIPPPHGVRLPRGQAAGRAAQGDGPVSHDPKPPHQGAQTFRAVEKEGRAFRLLPAGPLAERFLGDVSARGRGGRSPPRARAACRSWRRCESGPRRICRRPSRGASTKHYRRRRGRRLIDRIDAALVRVLQDCRLPAGVTVD